MKLAKEGWKWIRGEYKNFPPKKKGMEIYENKHDNELTLYSLNIL